MNFFNVNINNDYVNVNLYNNEETNNNSDSEIENTDSEIENSDSEIDDILINLNITYDINNINSYNNIININNNDKLYIDIYLHNLNNEKTFKIDSVYDIYSVLDNLTNEEINYFNFAKVYSINESMEIYYICKFFNFLIEYNDTHLNEEYNSVNINIKTFNV